MKIDAICINQEDQGEKSSQVQRMKEIYRNAKGVLVWVGKAKDHTDLAFKQAKKLLACTDFDTQQAIWSEPDEWIKALNEIVKRPVWETLNLEWCWALTSASSIGIAPGQCRKLFLQSPHCYAVVLTRCRSSNLHGSCCNK